MIGTGIPFREHGDHAAYLATLAPVMAATSGVRRFGVAALDLAYVAAGRFDGFWEFGLQPWDIAAGLLLVREAGGYVTDLDGAHGMLASGDVIAANDHLHPPLRFSSCARRCTASAAVRRQTDSGRRSPSAVRLTFRCNMAQTRVDGSPLVASRPLQLPRAAAGRAWLRPVAMAVAGARRDERGRPADSAVPRAAPSVIVDWSALDALGAGAAAAAGLAPVTLQPPPRAERRRHRAPKPIGVAAPRRLPIAAAIARRRPRRAQ